MRQSEPSAIQGVRRGFPSLPVVRDALKRLVPAIKSGALPAPRPAPWHGFERYDPSDAVLSAQRLAREVLDVYALGCSTVIVTFDDALEAAGRVEIGGHGQREFFVELQGELRDRPKDIAATLGHECAHVFLHRHGLEQRDVWANEILTDTTAALYGFGALMADTFQVSYRRAFQDGGVVVHRDERSMGYLTPDELGYVLTRVGFAEVDAYLDSTAARVAMGVGRDRAHRELAAPPFAHAGWWPRLLYRAHVWLARWRSRGPALGAEEDYAVHDGRVSFRCPQCCQGMRLPVGKRARATCPVCEHTMACVT